MTQYSRPATLRARTRELNEPIDLHSLVPTDGTAWIRHGEGMIGFGNVARYQGNDFAAAERWWNELTADISVESDVEDDPTTGPLAFGSFVFDSANTQHTSTLIVPQVIVGNRGGRSWVTVIARGDDPWPDVPLDLSEPVAPSGVHIAGGSLDREAWSAIVAEAVGRLDGTTLAKVVLARSEDVHADAPIDSSWLVRRLADRYPTCWTFQIAGLVGASPEMLVRRERGLATSRVLAGTIQRAGDQELDLALAHALARSSKNLIEHELAVASVAQALEPFCSGMNVPDAPYVLELPNVLHLASDVTAVARPGITALRLAGELHPSAAVCGTPTTSARALISELEHLDRGRYSGPVGWMDTSGDGEFAIALRSGWIHDDDPRVLSIYAGCGIVAESEPAEEYAETQAKLLPMYQALGLAQ